MAETLPPTVRVFIRPLTNCRGALQCTEITSAEKRKLFYLFLVVGPLNYSKNLWTDSDECFGGVKRGCYPTSNNRLYFSENPNHTSDPAFLDQDQKILCLGLLGGAARSAGIRAGSKRTCQGEGIRTTNCKAKIRMQKLKYNTAQWCV